MRIVVVALLAAGTAVVVAAALSTLVVRNRYVRLHVLAPASSLGVPLIVAAVAIDSGISRATLKVVLVGLLVATSGPVLASATGRALAVRDGRIEAEEPE